MIMKADGGVSIAGLTAAGKTLQISERGHLIGDPGCAYWLANKCLRMIYDNEEGIETTEFDLTAAKKAANAYFEMKTPSGILKPLYSDFSKERITKFYEPLAQLAERGDQFCVYLFKEAGARLGQLLKAYIDQATNEKEQISSIIDGILHMLGVGRIWKHYELLRPGFLSVIGLPDFSVEYSQLVRRVNIYQLDVPDSHMIALSAAKLSNPEFVIILEEIRRLMASEIIIKG